MEPSWPQQILCPIDFSETSARALRHAGRLARLSGGRITVAHAHSWEAPVYFTASRMADLERQFEEAKHEAEQALKEFVARESPGLPAAVAVVDAAPTEGILHLAKETSTDLLVMGTHGRSGWNRFLLGSVTERVIHETAIPVLTMPPVAGGNVDLPPVHRILCPVNDSAAARTALRHAARLASLFQAELIALHVVEPGPRTPQPDLCNWLATEERARCEMREMVVTGNAAERILGLAEEARADLVVIGARRTALRDATVIGTTSIRVVRHSPVPVLTVFE